MPLVRGEDEAQRQDQGGDAAVEVPVVRGLFDGNVQFLAHFDSGIASR